MHWRVLVLLLTFGDALALLLWMRSGSASSGKKVPRQKAGSEDDGGEVRRYIHKAVVESSGPLQLLQFLITTLPNVKRTQAKLWLSYDAVVVNGEAQSKFDYGLSPGDLVIVRAGKVAGAGSASARTDNLARGVSILHEDDHIIVVEKPFNMSVSKPVNVGAIVKCTRDQETSLLTNVNAFLNKRQGQKALLVHQVDKEASGVVLFAKTPEAKAYLQKHWSTFGRTFVCACRGYLFPLQGSWTTHLDESGENVKCYSSKSDIDAHVGKVVKLHTAINNYRTLETSKRAGARPLSLVEVSLATNRRDQVRCQFAHFGHPIVGETTYFSQSAEAKKDNLYLGSRIESRRLALHASEIRITHPATLEALRFSSRLPVAISRDFGPIDTTVLESNEAAFTQASVDRQRSTDSFQVISLDEYLGGKK